MCWCTIKYNDDNSRCCSLPQLVNENNRIRIQIYLTHTYLGQPQAWWLTKNIYMFLFTNNCSVLISSCCWAVFFFKFVLLPHLLFLFPSVSFSLFVFGLKRLFVRFMCIHLHNMCMKHAFDFIRLGACFTQISMRRFTALIMNKFCLLCFDSIMLLAIASSVYRARWR